MKSKNPAAIIFCRGIFSTLMVYSCRMRFVSMPWAELASKKDKHYDEQTCKYPLKDSVRKEARSSKE